MKKIQALEHSITSRPITHSKLKCAVGKAVCNVVGKVLVPTGTNQHACLSGEDTVGYII